MKTNSISTQLFKTLSLSDPFMIASSHWTSSEQSFNKLRPFAPSAVTLKTTSASKGGDGKDGKRDLRRLKDQFGSPFALYTDGPTTLELWDIATTFKMTDIAREILDQSLIGLSVLANEDYSVIAKSLNMDNYDYIELNWKYTFRIGNSDKNAFLEKTHSDLQQFLEIFSGRPIFIKLSRESLQLINDPLFKNILHLIQINGAALIIANSLRTIVPPSRVVTKPTELKSGVLVGEHLFLDTYNAIKNVRSLLDSAYSTPIIASGGVMDLGGILDLFVAGASAVQLCSAIDVRGPQIIELLRGQLEEIVSKEKNLETLITNIRSSETLWIQKLSEVKDVYLTADAAINEAFQKRDDIFEIVGQTLKNESSIRIHLKETGKKSSISKAKLDLSTIKIVVSKGSVFSNLLVRRIAKRIGAEPIEFDSGATFNSRLSNSDFDYNFAVINRSVWNYLKKDKSKKHPVEIAVVGKSMFELVGIRTNSLGDYKTVYHFSGVTSRHAWDELLLSIRPHFEEISTNHMHLLFKYWKTFHAVLAKPPLSRIYSLFLDPQSRDNWKPVWTCEEDILLVMNPNTQRNDQVIKSILSIAESERKKIRMDYRKAAQECMHGSYWNYFARLLGSSHT